METFKDLNRICKYPKCNCPQDDNCSTRLLSDIEKPLTPIWLRIAVAAWAIIILITALMLGGCSSKPYCPTYSSASYNAQQPHYPGKYNPVKH